MDPESEFNKPLKGHSTDRQKNRSLGVLVASAIALAVALPVFHFYGGFGYLAGLFNSSSEVVEATSSQPEKQVEIVLRDTVEQDLKPKHELDPEKGDFQEVEPQGQITPLKPVPTIQPRVQKVRRQEQTLAHLPDPDLVERGATGVIPKRSNDGLRAMDVYSRRPDTEGNFGVARVVIVIGGLGISQTSTQQAIKQLPPSVTLAFAPYGNSLSRWMQQARKNGHELLLQVPMEPIDYPQNNPGPHTILAEADLQENLANLHWSMSRITNYVGVTNYLGNKILSQPASLSPIFSELSQRGLLFLEDGSVKNSVGEGVALKELLPYAKGNILLDNVRSRSAIAEKLSKLAAQAKRTGLAIGVGNAFPDTIDLVAQFSRQAGQNGIEVTPVSAVVRDPTK